MTAPPCDARDRSARDARQQRGPPFGTQAHERYAAAAERREAAHAAELAALRAERDGASEALREMEAAMRDGADELQRELE